MVAEVHVYIATSLDGYIARKNGELDWLPQVAIENEDYGYKKFMDSMDVLIMGRNTYEKVRLFKPWPYADKDVVVLSNGTLTIPKKIAKRITHRTGSPKEIIEWATKQGYKKIYLDGGRAISTFLNSGLVKEMIITTIPVILGQGIPLFNAIEKDIKLNVVNTKAYDNGLVQTKYQV